MITQIFIFLKSNVGTNSYDLKIDKPEYGLKKGTIFTSLFLNNLKKNVSLNDIGENINENIERLKKIDNTFSVISRVKFQTTCQRINFGSKANDNAKYLEPINSLICKLFQFKEFFHR